MANDQIKNAANFMEDPELRRWLVAGMAYTARLVLSEPPVADGAVRRALADQVALEPDNPNQIRILQNLFSVDPEVFVFSTVEAVGQDLLLAKIAGMWSLLAEKAFPELVVVPPVE